MTHDNMIDEIRAVKMVKDLKEYLDSTQDLFEPHNSVPAIIIQRVHKMVKEFYDVYDE